MKSWSTIHIFGYGESQIIGIGDDDKGFSNKVATTTLTKVTPFIDDLFTHQPTGNTSVKTEYHVIHLFHNNEVRFVSKTDGVEGFTVKMDVLNQTTLQELVDELASAA
jgi:hypothetical protein